jgi:type I restriction enzyme S subunit
MTDQASNQMPTGWRLAKIGELFESWGGHTPSKANRSYWGPGLPWISSKEVKATRLKTSTYTVTQKAIEETGLRVCPVGSVLVVVRSGILAHTLPVAVTEAPVTINQDLKAFYSDEPFLNEWLALFLRMSAHELLASSRRDGTTVQSVQYPLLKNTLIPIPPTEQRQQLIDAVQYVLSKQATIPPYLEASRRAIDRFRQAVLIAACSGRLTADWRERNSTEPTIPIVDLKTRTASSRRIASALKGFTNQTLPELPESWCWAPLGAISESVLGKMLDKVKNKGEPKPYLRNVNVRWRGFDLRDLLEMRFEPGEDERYGLHPGDVVICEGGEPGRAAVWRAEMPEMRFQKALHRVRCDNILLPEWLVNVLQEQSYTGQLTNYFTGTGIAHLTGISLLRVPIPLPPIAEQRELIRIIDALWCLADSVHQKVESASRSVNRTSQAILAKAFRGELTDKPSEVEPV